MKRILVIDDDSQIRQMLRQMLEREGYEVVDAPDGQEGIRLYYSKRIDLVIVDIFMPEKDGLEVIFQLRRNSPGVKIIAMSGGCNLISKEDSLNLCDSLRISKCTKPVARQELLEKVNRLLVDVHVSQREVL